MGDCLVVAYHYALNDPPSRQAAESLAEAGHRVTVMTIRHPANVLSAPPRQVTVDELPAPKLSARHELLSRLLRWRAFRSAVRKSIRQREPSLIVPIMFHALQALPQSVFGGNRKVICCIYDIPPLEDAGNLDRWIIRRAWQRLHRANVIWASDIYKAQLAQRFGGLPELPLICHNCPPLDYLPEPAWPRDAWLREELQRQGATIGRQGGCILLRAGAVGECGGIEETLAAMPQLPEDYVFLMMGRPPEDYKQKLVSLIGDMGLRRRAFFWDRPSDDVWKKALLSADIGHLIHGPFPPGRMTRLYEFNSSLSNNRLFQYMAAGLPIIAYDDPRMSLVYQEVACFRVARLICLREDILSAWKELGLNAALRQALGCAGRNAHLVKFCWEQQFAPVRDRIQCVGCDGADGVRKPSNLRCCLDWPSRSCLK